MKLVSLKTITFHKDVDFPGGRYSRSAQTKDRTEVDYWVDERLIVVTFTRRDEDKLPPELWFYPLEGELHFECPAMAKIVLDWKATQKAKEETEKRKGRADVAIGHPGS